MVSIRTHDLQDPGSNLGSGECCFLFLMSIESDSKSHYIGVVTFYLGLYSFIILWSSAVSAVKVNLGNWSLSSYWGGPTPFLYTHLVYIWQKSDGHVH